MDHLRVLGFATLPKTEARRVVREHPELANPGEQAPVILAFAARDAAEAGAVSDLMAAVTEAMSEQTMAVTAVLGALLPPGRLTSLSPALLEQVRRNADAQAQLADEFGLLSSTEVASLAGSKAVNAPALASRWRKQGRLFTVEADQTLRYPGFQLDDSGRPLPVIAEILKAFGGKLSGWELALWFTSSNTWLGDLRPVDVVVSDSALVTAAASRLAEELLS